MPRKPKPPVVPEVPYVPPAFYVDAPGKRTHTPHADWAAVVADALARRCLARGGPCLLQVDNSVTLYELRSCNATASFIIPCLFSGFTGSVGMAGEWESAARARKAWCGVRGGRAAARGALGACGVATRARHPRDSAARACARGSA